jgi:hypothetical protein
MSVALHKRNHHRLADVPHIGLMSILVPASMIILTNVILVGVLGHFFPAG